jgi:hypothetical protein
MKYAADKRPNCELLIFKSCISSGAMTALTDLNAYDKKYPNAKQAKTLNAHAPRIGKFG